MDGWLFGPSPKTTSKASFPLCSDGVPAAAESQQTLGPLGEREEEHLKLSGCVCSYTTSFKGQFHPVKDFRGQESGLSPSYRLSILSVFLSFILPLFKSRFQLRRQCTAAGLDATTQWRHKEAGGEGGGGTLCVERLSDAGRLVGDPAARWGHSVAVSQAVTPAACWGTWETR